MTKQEIAETRPVAPRDAGRGAKLSNHIDDVDPARAATRATPAMVSLARGARVVVVNDASAVLALYGDMLAEMDYDAVVMATEAIETARIRAANPDAVILDLTVGLQAEYGVEMAKELRADHRYSALPIVVATANADALDGARQALQEIGVPILLKPFTFEELQASLASPKTQG